MWNLTEQTVTTEPEVISVSSHHYRKADTILGVQ